MQADIGREIPQFLILTHEIVWLDRSHSHYETTVGGRALGEFFFLGKYAIKPAHQHHCENIFWMYCDKLQQKALHKRYEMLLIAAAKYQFCSTDALTFFLQCCTRPQRSHRTGNTKYDQRMRQSPKWHPAFLQLWTKMKHKSPHEWKSIFSANPTNQSNKNESFLKKTSKKQKQFKRKIMI